MQGAATVRGVDVAVIGLLVLLTLQSSGFGRLFSVCALAFFCAGAYLDLKLQTEERHDGRRNKRERNGEDE